MPDHKIFYLFLPSFFFMQILSKIRRLLHLDNPSIILDKEFTDSVGLWLTEKEQLVYHPYQDCEFYKNYFTLKDYDLSGSGHIGDLHFQHLGCYNFGDLLQGTCRLSGSSYQCLFIRWSLTKSSFLRKIIQAMRKLFQCAIACQVFQMTDN